MEHYNLPVQMWMMTFDFIWHQLASLLESSVTQNTHSVIAIWICVFFYSIYSKKMLTHGEHECFHFFVFVLAAGRRSGMKWLTPKISHLYEKTARGISVFVSFHTRGFTHFFLVESIMLYCVQS